MALKRATEKLIESLETQPMAVAGIKGVGHTGASAPILRPWPPAAASAAFTGGGGHKEHPSVAPFGGRKGVLSTNPTAMAMPGMDGVALSADFATASSAGGKLRLALRKGVQLPEGRSWTRTATPPPTPRPILTAA